MQGVERASTATPAAPRRTTPNKAAGILRWWAYVRLQREGLQRARSARLARWLCMGIMLWYALRILGSEQGVAVLRNGLSALIWPALVSVPAMFRATPEARVALERLAVLHGVPSAMRTSACWAAEATLVSGPLAAGAVTLWLCSAVGAASAKALLLHVVGLAATLMVQSALTAALAGLGAVARQLSPGNAQRTTWLLLLVPALLFAVVPELPSLWHAYQHWVTWSVSLMGSP